MKVATAVKGISLVGIAKEIEEGKEKAVLFPTEKEKYVRSFVSAILGREFPDRKYTVNKTDFGVKVYWEAI